MGLILLFIFFFIIFVIFIFVNNLINKRAKVIGQSLFDDRRREIENIKQGAIKEINFAKQNLEEEIKFFNEYKEVFEQNYISGRTWLAEFIAEADKTRNDKIAKSLVFKKRPAYKASDELKRISTEKRDLIKKHKLLEYQLKTYEEYFPFLKDFEEPILNEEIDFLKNDPKIVSEDIDRVSLFLDKDEYAKLSVVEKNQLALDRYLSRPKHNWEIGRFYERYIGFMYETDKWDVEFSGAIKGYEDLGRDLICKKSAEVHIVQAKCWAAEKTIYEKHIFQLYGTTLSYEIENSFLPEFLVKPIFITTTKLSDVAKLAAERLGVEVRTIKLERKYPIIKCNVTENEKIYHLPFDQQYDRVKIQNHGEFYASTVQEAEAKGFRRAKRFFANNT